MKKVVLLFALICIFTSLVNAQQTSVSPLEGRWVWDERGYEAPDFIEMVFMGNVMLVRDKYEPFYFGIPFTYTDSIISSEDYTFRLQYRFAGDTLVITDDFNDTFNFTRINVPPSPLEGIWRAIGGAGFDPEADQYMLFTGDIMAIGEDGGFFGMIITFHRNSFRPAILLPESTEEGMLVPQDEIEAFLNSMRMEYAVLGNRLTLNHQGEDFILVRVH